MRCDVIAPIEQKKNSTAIGSNVPSCEWPITTVAMAPITIWVKPSKPEADPAKAGFTDTAPAIKLGCVAPLEKPSRKNGPKNAERRQTLRDMHPHQQHARQQRRQQTPIGEAVETDLRRPAPGDEIAAGIGDRAEREPQPVFGGRAAEHADHQIGRGREEAEELDRVEADRQRVAEEGGRARQCDPAARQRREIDMRTAANGWFFVGARAGCEEGEAAERDHRPEARPPAIILVEQTADTGGRTIGIIAMPIVT